MPRIVVVDGSNIATEGRSAPSLSQLHEAVMAFREEFPDDLITVVVDATFGHRINSRELPEFEAAVEHNELVTPPAGAIGRGDAFVLTIANKAHAAVLSNDSFQEFHGEYTWLFDEGRLIGGKPVPHVGWVFVARAPVRGPVSRRAVRDAKGGTRVTTTRGRRAAAAVPAVEPAGADGEAAAAATTPKRGRARVKAPTAPLPAVPPVPPPVAPPPPAPRTEAPTPSRAQAVNELLPFLSFVEAHPVGSTIEATVDSYSSHGAYVTVGETRCYVPLRLMGEPAPRSARDVLALGVTVPLVVTSFNPARRSIDLALPGHEPDEVKAAAAARAAAPVKKARARKKAAAPVDVAAEAVVVVVEKAAAPAKKARARKKAAAPVEAPVDVPVEAPAEPVPAEVTKPAKRARKKAAPGTPA